MTTQRHRWMMATMLLSFAMGCDDSQSPSGDPSNPQQIQIALDNMYEAPTGMSLLVLGDGADYRSVADVVDDLGGQALHVLPPRLIVAKVPQGADPVLVQSGMAQRFERAVQEGDIDDATEAEARFARVFSNRYYPESVPEDEKLVMRHAVVPEGEQWESSATEEAAQQASHAMAKAASTESIQDDIDAESWLYVPYASGTVVVSLWLPESNGVAEPSTEDWTEDQIAQVYEKVQTALEAFFRHEPNSRLRFVLHFESAPAPGGLTGTIDHDWEFGKQANWGSGGDESRSIAALLGTVLRRDVDVGNSWQAYHDYLNGLRSTYHADAAFIVMVAANGNGTASLRAHASLFGPSTVLHSLNDWSVFMHEFGHIFGAGDEYCPDACWLPTSTHGYLGAINANATYQDGGPGINNGRGESQPSLMTYNAVNALNGYTRSAIGWLDSDGDGIIEVRDTYPSSDLAAVTYRGGSVHLVGWIVDVPQSPLWQTRYSVNRIEKLEYRFADVEGSPWFEVQLPACERGREYVDTSIGTLPLGDHTLEVRAINSVGNVEPSPKRLVAHGTATVTAPRLRLSSPLSVGGVTTRFPIDVSYLDLDGDDVTVSLDLDADGVLETVIDDPMQLIDLRSAPLAAGRHVISALVSDSTGLSTTAEITVLVLDGNAAPAVKLTTPTNQVNGSAEANVHLEASDVLDPEGQEVLYNWIVEVAGDPYNTERLETGFGTSRSFDTVLRTPSRVVAHPLDLTASGAVDVFPERIRDLVMVRENVIAVALGKYGVALFDIANRKSPRLLSHAQLETTAYHLAVDGNRLFVLGGQLAIVDISNLTAPKEIRQWWRTTSRIVSEETEPQDIWNNGWTAHHKHYQTRDEKIVDVAVKVIVDHPDPSKLTFVLESDKEVGVGAIVLLDRDPKAKNRRTFNFTTANTPELRSAIGAFTGGDWSVAVYDQSSLETKGEPNVVGTLVASRIRFDTAHQAIPVLPGASRILGVVNKNYVVVAGNGLQVIETSFPGWAYEAARLSGAPIADAVLVGRTVLGGALPEKKPEILDLNQSTPLVPPSASQLSGLFAVDLTTPYSPRIRRQEPKDVEQFAVVGSRFYATLVLPDAPKGTPHTLVGDISSFVRGRFYELGRIQEVVRAGALGNDEELWTLDWAGRLTRLDVRNPSDVRFIEVVDEPYMDQVLHLSEREILGRNWSSVFTANLDERESVVSRVYQITLEAKDAAGAVTQKVRNIHVVPYAHAPSIASVEVVSGTDVTDVYQILVRVSDPDMGASWDPYVFVRVDFDNDGILESLWASGGDNGEVTIWKQFPRSGTYNLEIEARDGFYGRSQIASFSLVVPDHVDIPCGGDLGDTCAADEYCHRLGQDACDKATTGVCKPRWQPCSKDEPDGTVCGCDGQTYHRACDAYYQGINVASDGECPIVACTSNNDCSFENQFCMFEPNYEDPSLSCGNAGPGVCQPIPERCYIIYRADQESILPRLEVCGCDGRTYNSSCAANQSGISVLHAGVCQEP